jgi:putative sugar O-methyltransferase
MTIEAAIMKLNQYQMQDSEYFTVSDGWDKIFSERRNLTADNVSLFLNPSHNLANGIGMTNNSVWFERKEANLLYKITTRKNNNIQDTLQLIKSEGLFGEVTHALSENINLSRPSLMNGGTFHSLRGVMDEHLCLNKATGIRILEIGSGYGELCRQIIKYSGFNNISYDLVDLPTNLFFAEYYLSTVFGDKNVDKRKFFDKKDLTNISKNNCKLRFFDPSECTSLSEYDLVINSYSLQEMKSVTVRAYTDLIFNKMSDKAIFFSCNAPRKWDIQSYSDYGFHNFQNIYSNMNRQIPPAGLNATVPIVNVFCKRTKKQRPLSETDIEIMNNIGILHEFGLLETLNQVNLGDLSITDPSGPLHEAFKRYSLGKNNVNSNITIRFLLNLLDVENGCDEFSENIFGDFVNSDAFKTLSDLSLLKLSKISNNYIVGQHAKKLQKYYRTPLLFKVVNKILAT